MKKLGILVVAIIYISLMCSCVNIQIPVTETYYETEYKTEYRTETYTETQNVVVSTNERSKFLEPVVRWNDNISLEGISGVDSTYYYGYRLYDWDFNPFQHPNVQVKITISPLAQQKDVVKIYDLTGIGQIPTMPTSASGLYIGPFLYTYTYQVWFDTMLMPALRAAHIIGEWHTGTATENYLRFDAKNITDFAILVNSYNFYMISGVELTWSDNVIEQKTVTKQRQVPYQVPVQVEKQRTITQTQRVPFWEAIFR